MVKLILLRWLDIVGDGRASMWGNLPADVMDLILQRLPLVDHLRVGAVCKAWKRVEAAAFKPPMLFLPGTSSHPFPTMAYLDDKSIRKLNVSHCKGYCVGSLKGWLLMRESRGGLFLLNAFSGERIWLPPMDYPVKCIVTATPTLENVYRGKCVVACVFGSKLGICRPTDKQWTFFSSLNQSSNDSYREIVFCDGKLYAASTSLALEVWDVDGDEPEVTILAVAPPRCKGIKTDNDVRRFYLVDSIKDPLMIVCSSFDWTPDFWVFKLVNQEWVQVDSLGNKIVLVGQYGSEVVCAGRSNDSEVGNCIYYTAYTNRDWFCGIFSLKDRSVERIKLHSVSPPAWITWHPPDIGAQIRATERPCSIRYQTAVCGGESFIVMWVCSRDYETYVRIFKEKQQAPPELIELDCLKLDILKSLEPIVRTDFLINNIM